MTHGDWILFCEFTFLIVVIFYLRAWHLESARGGSWRAGHRSLWKKPQKWQLITFCMLWGFIVLGLILLFATQRSN